ncbi:acetate/propionate family kinase [Marinivivus vitaminiproducens]|uniref:acetate/propionate family kinase n=1 Tax=Marinivivus vitaminiproducens TaxID=3035935 RepID=UPI0027A4783D|nr:acetate/propionate family kinase [Geminicoccaceae bacterium SCSIO 64248]
MAGVILVLNAGSSSIKFETFELREGELTSQASGQVDGIGTDRPHLRAKSADGAVLADEALTAEQASSVDAAQDVLGAFFRRHETVDLLAVGHRVVHGGLRFARPIRVDEAAIEAMAELTPLAPLHQPHSLAPMRSILRRRPDLPQVACFDTAFHRGHGDIADRFALPEWLYADGVRRYGFHGLSYAYIASRLPALSPRLANGKTVVAHLGSGCSMCALDGCRSVDSTMGFTALDGLPMGTRPGQLDAGVVLYLIREKGMAADAVERLLYHECGLKGLSGVSNDVRALTESDDPRARLALDYFCTRAAMAVAELAAFMGGLDGLVFTAGIGEHSAFVRAGVARRLAWLGAELAADANERGDGLVSSPDSRIEIRVIPTDEELMIARHTVDLLGLR